MAESIQEKVQRLYQSTFRMDSPLPYQTEDDPDNARIFQRWTDDDVEEVFIKRIIITTDVNKKTYTTTYAFDLWSNRVTATYYAVPFV